jgi:Tfp pilus assembly PilM family ATPase
VAAAPEKVLAEINSAAEFAGFKAIQIVPVQVAFANAALLAKEQLINKDPLVLLHIGTNTSTVSFLFDENITLTRVIRIGREQLARALNQARQTPANLSSEMRSGLIQSNLQHALTPLAHEIRAAIDYFEDLYSQRVSAGFVTGQIALDDLVIESLQVLEIPCQRINSERLFKAVETSRAE